MGTFEGFRLEYEFLGPPKVFKRIIYELLALVALAAVGLDQ